MSMPPDSLEDEPLASPAAGISAPTTDPEPDPDPNDPDSDDD